MKLKNTASVLFWNVDTQNDFMKASGKLYVQDAEEIELTLERLTRFAKKYNIKVLNTCDFHNEKTIELSSTPDFIATFPPHCMENTEGQDFVMATKPDIAVIFDWDKEYSSEEIREMVNSQRNIVIRKDFFDVFYNNPNAENVVNALAPKKIFVYGVATNVCVNFAVKGLAKRGYNVFVIEDAIKELPNIPMPFENWKTYGVALIKAQEIVNYI